MEFDFSKNQEVTKIDDVPADFRPLYKEKEDKSGFILDAADPRVKTTVSLVTGLNVALKAARSDAKTKIDLTLLKDFGDSPEAIKAKVDDIVAKLQEQVKGVNVEKIRKEIEQEGKKKIDELTAQLSSQDGEFKEEFVNQRAAKAIADEKGDTELLLPIVAAHTEARRINGKYTVLVVDADKEIRYSGATGHPMSIKELVAEIKQDKRYGKLFESDKRGGGGAAPGGASNPSQIRQVQQKRAGGVDAVSKISAGLRRGVLN